MWDSSYGQLVAFFPLIEDIDISNLKTTVVEISDYEATVDAEYDMALTVFDETMVDHYQYRLYLEKTGNEWLLVGA